MHRMILIAAVAALGACAQDDAPDSANDTTVVATDENMADAANAAADANAAAPRASAAGMSLLNTTWEFSDDGVPMVISINQAGAYIENRGDGTHVDHGTYAQKDGKDCFTSAMGDKGTNCWTAVPEVEIGATASATADDGQSGVFKRVAYRELKLPG